MRDYDPATYGNRMAEVYDDWFGTPENAEAAAAFLAGLTGPVPALELGIRTERVAIPLSQRGVEVHGIDASGLGSRSSSLTGSCSGPSALIHGGFQSLRQPPQGNHSL